MMEHVLSLAFHVETSEFIFIAQYYSIYYFRIFWVSSIQIGCSMRGVYDYEMKYLPSWLHD